MAFTIFYPDTTVSAADMNANFQHIGNGNWLPRGGSSLDATTGVYDLGSASYPWNNVYVHTLNVSGYSNTNSWNMVSSVTLSSTATSVEFTGLSGDVLRITGNFIFSSPGTTGTDYYLYFNGNSSTNYGETGRVNLSGTLYAVKDTSTAGIAFYAYTGGSSSFEFLLYSKPGFERMLLTKYSRLRSTGVVLGDFQTAMIWNNTSATITSLKFSGPCSLDPGTAIQVWRAD